MHLRFSHFHNFKYAGAMKALLLFCSATVLFAADPPARWSAKSAAAYLDGRMEWWITWKTAERDHDTFCVSCHTVAPYAVGRPALRSALHEPGPSPAERKLIDNVTKRAFDRGGQWLEPIAPCLRGEFPPWLCS